MEQLRQILTNLDTIQVAMYSLYFLMLVIVLMIIYLISTYVELEIKEEEKKEFDIEIAKIALEKLEEEPKEIILGDYELEQENTAIISYDELLEQTTNMSELFNERIEQNENYNEEFAPISYEELEKGVKKENQVIDANVELTQQDLEEELSMTKEMAYLKNLKEFRANLK